MTFRLVYEELRNRFVISIGVYDDDDALVEETDGRRGYTCDVASIGKRLVGKCRPLSRKIDMPPRVSRPRRSREIPDEINQ